MLTAIIVYLISGGVITLYLCNTLNDVAEDDALAMKVIFYAGMIVTTPPIFIYGFAKGIYQRLKNKSES